MSRSFIRLLFLFGVLLPTLVLAKQSEVMNARIWESPESTRLVLELSDSVEYRVMTLVKPDRIVIDVSNTAKRPQIFNALELSTSPLKAIRTAKRNQNDLRIVLDLKEKVEEKSFLLKANELFKIGYNCFTY